MSDEGKVCNFDVFPNISRLIEKQSKQLCVFVFFWLPFSESYWCKVMGEGRVSCREKRSLFSGITLTCDQLFNTLPNHWSLTGWNTPTFCIYISCIYLAFANLYRINTLIFTTSLKRCRLSGGVISERASAEKTAQIREPSESWV